jgi:hypothetical protein
MYKYRNNPPRYLYRFISGKNKIESILNGTFWFSNILKFDKMDPKDSRPEIIVDMTTSQLKTKLNAFIDNRYPSRSDSVGNPRHIRKFIKKTLNKTHNDPYVWMEWFTSANEYTISNLAACCFSDDVRNPDMWSKNKDSIAFVFDSKLLGDMCVDNMLHMRYVEIPSISIQFEDLVFYDNPNGGIEYKPAPTSQFKEKYIVVNTTRGMVFSKEKILDILELKYKDYSYESEWRLLVPNPHSLDGLLIKYNLKALCGVVYSKTTSKDIVDYINSNGVIQNHSIPVCKDCDLYTILGENR